MKKKKLANEEKRLAIEANNFQIKKLADEERIMSMDINSLNESQKEYYMSLQT